MPKTTRQQGFTLVELMVVVAIFGLIAGWMMVDYSGMTERQRLHSTVREFVGIYRENRAFAAKERRHVEIEYDIEGQAYRVVVYPRTDELGNWVDSYGEILDPDVIDDLMITKRWKDFPNHVFLADIEAPGPGGSEIFDIDYWLRFRHNGTVPPHILHFETSSGLQMSLEVEEVTGSVTVRDGRTTLLVAEESDFNIIAGRTEDDG